MVVLFVPLALNLIRLFVLPDQMNDEAQVEAHARILEEMTLLELRVMSWTRHAH